MHWSVYCILHICFPGTCHKLSAVDLFENTGSPTRTCSLLYFLARIGAPKSGPKICLVHLKGNNLIDLVGFGPTEVVFWVASPGNLEDPLLFDEGGLSTTSPEASSTRKLVNTKFTTNSGSASMTSKVRFPTSKDGCFCIYSEQDPNKKRKYYITNMRKTWPRGHGVVGSWCKQSCCSCSFIFIFKPGHIDCRHHHRIFHGRFGAISMATKRVTVLIPRLRWMSFWNVEELSMNAEGVRKFSMCQFGGLMLYFTLIFEYV